MSPRRILSVAPGVDRAAAWESLRGRLGRPAREGAVVLREGRLLHVPYWFEEGSPADPAPWPRLLPASDLVPVGLPSNGPGAGPGPRRAAAALGAAREGPPPADPSDPDEAVVDVVLDPDGPGPPAGWSLVYYPFWSMRVATHHKERFLAVDAVTAEAAGTALGPRWARAAAAAAAAMLGGFWLAYPLMGAASALPAWVASQAALAVALRRGRA